MWKEADEEGRDPIKMCAHDIIGEKLNLVSDPRGSQVVQLPMGEIVKYGGI